MSNTQVQEKAGPARVPAKFRSFDRVKADIQATQNIVLRPLQQQSLNVTTGENKISFQMPNNKGFLLSNLIRLSGQINFNITSTSGSDTFALLKPSVTNDLMLIDRWQLYSGSTLLAESLNPDVNMCHYNFQSNSINNLNWQQFSAQPFVVGSTAPSNRSFRTPIEVHPSEIFGRCPSMEDQSKVDTFACNFIIFKFNRSFTPLRC